MTAVVEPRANYVQTTWVDDSPPGTGTPLNAANMNKLEGGIGAALPMRSVFTAGVSAYANNLLAADAQAAFAIMGDGRHWWGPGGSTAQDTSLYRSGAGVLRTDGEFQATSRLNTSSYLLVHNGGAAQSVFGDVSLFLGAPSRAGLIFGNLMDTVLYRSAAGVLQTDTAFVGGGTSSKRVELSVDRLGGGQASINFGSASDTNLYRSAAGQLKTDGQFQVVGSLVAGWTGSTWGMSLQTNGFLQIAGNIYSGFGLANQLQMATDGRIYFGSANDTNLYRSAASTLKTDSVLAVASDLYVRIGSAWQVFAGYVAGNAGLQFGSASDANLYRSGANTLTTDGALIVGGAGSSTSYTGLWVNVNGTGLRNVATGPPNSGGAGYKTLIVPN